MRKPYLIIHKRALSEDSWTYGDWRQYIARRDNGGLQCCRISILPLFATVIPAAFLLLVAMAVLIGNMSVANLNPLPVLIAFMVLGLGAALQFGDYRLAVPVGPVCFDGRRRFWHEEEAEDEGLHFDPAAYDSRRYRGADND